ncbi:MAG: hydrophobe/amphiphile efflux-3 (HAE3) family transporter [Methanofollis sp.]|uniref:efflux RND transporter permease subunit n=1 Tax=Methanofollis sp. TaxID=2052835 RepID=UPI0026245064|nr:hydrophobe/amphiphile efflux-3 (HAE3) family transporter [Methanofollis sp.]MDD4254264.1 hydrophobe/amphiphile efflux-3 (HAE3) family transporter [Methanofollis sp.]
MKSPYQIIADMIVRHPAVVAGFFVAALLVAFYGMGLVSMETGSDTYIDKTTTRGMLFDKYADSFMSDSIMLLVETDDVLNPDVLAYIDRLQADIADEQYVDSTRSITDLVRQVNGGTLPTSAAEVQRAKALVPPEIMERYVPSNMMTIAIITLDPGVSSDVRENVLNSIASVVAISSPPPGVGVTVSGDPAFAQQMKQEMGASMGVLIGAAMLLMILAVGLLFSHVRYRLLPVAIVATGLIFTFGLMGVVGIHINMATIGAFPVLIGIGIDYAIQFHSRFEEERRLAPIDESVITTITKTGPSVLYAMLSTSMGFVAMGISPVPMVRSFGMVCVIGVMMCYLTALIAVPTFGVLVKYRPKKEGNVANSGATEAYNQFLGNLAVKIAKNPIPILIILGLVAFIGVEMDSEIRISTDEQTFVPSDMPAVVDLKKIVRTMGSTQTLPIYIRGDDVTSLESLQWMQGFSDYEVKENAQITGVTSIITEILRYNNGAMPQTDAEARAVLDRIPDETKNKYLAGNMGAVVQFSLTKMEMEQAKSLVTKVRKDIAWEKPPVGIVAEPTGNLELFTTLIDDIETGKTQMTILGFGLILTFLFLVYRKIGKAVSPLVPIIMIVGWNGLIMYALGIDYTPLTACLGSMTIGVASEYTILIMERFYEEREKGRELYDAIQQSVSQIGTAITVSGMTTVFGFSALILSTFNIIQNFGVVTVITVGFSLIGAIIVMPAVLSLIGRSSRNPASKAENE